MRVINKEYNIVGVQLSNGKSMKIDEFKHSRGEIDYSFSHLKNVIEEINDSSLVKHCVYIDVLNPKLSVIVSFGEKDEYVRFSLEGEGTLTYSKNNESEIITDWETADMKLLISKYGESLTNEAMQKVIIPREVIHGMFTELRLILGQYRNKCELGKNKWFMRGR